MTSNRPTSSLLSATYNPWSAIRLPCTFTTVTQYWSAATMARQGSLILTSHRAYKRSTTEVSLPIESRDCDCSPQTHRRTRQRHRIRCLWSPIPMIGALTKTFVKGHAFEDPDNFLIATVFNIDSSYTVHLWNTIRQGNNRTYYVRGGRSYI